MSWMDNSIMYWSLDGTNWNKITDHNRQPLSISVERIEKKSRMVDATLRKYTVAKKRTFQLSWSNLPSARDVVYNGKVGLTTVDGGWAGEDIETFHNNTDGSFKVMLRKGTDEAKDITDATIEVVNVMISDFSKEVVKRGVVDLWNLDITLEEV